MKLITIFNFPNQDNYNKLCEWWLKQALHNSDVPIEVWYYDNINHLHYIPELWDKRVKMVQKPKVDISTILPENLVSEKAQHNVGFKLYNLCQETDPFIFVDADAIILQDIEPLISASKDKPMIMVNHQRIHGHTAHLLFEFLNSGVQVVGDPSWFDFKKIVEEQVKAKEFMCPGTDQAMIWNYCVRTGYDYTHPEIGHKWNWCAGVVSIKEVCINHYWYKFKPWIIDCPRWEKFLGETE